MSESTWPYVEMPGVPTTTGSGRLGRSELSDPRETPVALRHIIDVVHGGRSLRGHVCPISIRVEVLTKRQEVDAMRSYERDGLIFDVTDGGPRDGSVILLLHGWPGGATTWERVAPELREAGYRTLVPDQRGYSPRARPRGRRPYVVAELVADVIALMDAAELERVHIVGHDWGGAVAWAMADREPERLASLTVLSTPHPRAMSASLRTSAQSMRSAYVAGFQLPVLPEQVLLAGGGAVLRQTLRRSGLHASAADAYVDRQRQPGALSASLAWYRALPLSCALPGVISVPTRYVWSSNDAALGRRAAELTSEHVAGPYTFEVIEGASHWLPEERPSRVAVSVLDHVNRFSMNDVAE